MLKSQSTVHYKFRKPGYPCNITRWNACKHQNQDS
uniref:Uncharacterized protein n=1 Tax=Arundo donax TaxID=35708 RepID=A0A0A9BWK2_ARUDO